MMFKKVILGISLCILIVFIVGISYALWRNVSIQNGENVIITDCFHVTLEEEQGIFLKDAIPMYDREGMQLKPYLYRVENVCDKDVMYQMNLETTKNSSLDSKYVKMSLNQMDPIIVSHNEETEVTLTNGLKSYQLEEGILRAHEIREYDLRIWMDENVTQKDVDAMNRIFESKITFVIAYIRPMIANTIKSIPKVTEGNGLYEVCHSDAEITYTEDSSKINHLKQTEYRYAGSNPENYVKFNNELWRIIGLVNTPEGSRVKLIRNESIGFYSWDVSDSTINIGRGINEWSISKLKYLLNEGGYYHRRSDSCYDQGELIACDFSRSGLTNEAKEMIDTVTWNLGSSIAEDGVRTVLEFYNDERQHHVILCNSSYMTCNDNVARNDFWVGEVGLMYPSDYGYATSGGSNINRETCLNTVFDVWNSMDHSDCKNNDWLLTSDYQWTLTPFEISNSSSRVFYISLQGNVRSAFAKDVYDSKGIGTTVRLSVYLKQNIKIIDGNGSFANPYQLALF